MFASLFEVYNAVLLLVLLLGCAISQDYNSPRNVNTKLLETMKSYMDLEQDPCEDFYRYACGNWEQVHTDTGKYVDTIGSLAYLANEQMVDILEQRIGAEKRDRNEVYRKVRDYYETCKEEAELQVETYLDILKPATDENWPQRWDEYTTTWQGDTWNWLETLGKLRGYGLNGVLLKQEVNNKNATEFYLLLDKADQADLTAGEQAELALLQQSPYIKERSIKENVRRFSGKLNTLIQSQRTTPSQVYETTLRDLQQRVPHFDFQAYLTALLQEPVSEELPLLVSNFVYLRKLNDLIGKTSKETLIYYIKLKLLTYLRAQMPKSPTPQHCVQNMREYLALALDYIYDREQYRFGRNQTDAVILKVFSTMQAKFLDIIAEHAAELSEEELAYLQAKISQMQVNIGNLPSEVAEHYFKEYYHGLQIERGYFHWNHLNAMQHAVIKQHALLKLRILSPEHTYYTWKFASPAYLPKTNLLLIPFAYLQMPIFHRDFHELFLYAELGNTLGHEIMHGFDTTGLVHDASGNPSTVLANAMRQKPHFAQSLSCLQQERTSDIDEKLADFSGLRLAYESYFQQPQVGKFREERVLTNKQLFFVKFAQFFCAISPRRIKYDQTHDTPFKRVPEALANFGEFAQEFGCAENSRMNARRRCKLW